MSKPQQIGSGQKTQELQGRLFVFLACSWQRSQHSCADDVRWLMPKTTAAPPVSECGSSPQIGAVVTPGPSAAAAQTSRLRLEAPGDILEGWPTAREPAALLAHLFQATALGFGR